MAETKQLPWVIHAENLVVTDGKLTWDGSEKQGELFTKDIFLLVKPKQGGRRATLCLLKEDPDSADTPYQLSLVTTNQDKLPDAISAHHAPVTELPDYLQSGPDIRIDIIVSTNSGTGKALIFWKSVLQPLLRFLCDEFGVSSSVLTTEENVLVTQSAESVSDFARSLVPSAGGKTGKTEERRTVILLSGDGGIVDLLNGVERVEESTGSSLLPIIALLPLGTGNALFHSTHKQAYSHSHMSGLSPLGWSLRTLFQGEAYPLPAFEATFPTGSHIVAPGTEPDFPDSPLNRPVTSLRGAIVASYGFHASLIYQSDTPAYRKHGAKRFGMVAQELLGESYAYSARVQLSRPGSSSSSSSAPEVVAREHHAYVLTTLVSNLEQAFTISPASRPLDGKLRTIHFGPLGGERTMEAMKAAYDGGKHVDLKWDDGQRIHYDEVEEIRIEALDEDKRWRKVCIDGTIVGLPKGGQVTVRSILPHSPLRLLISREGLRDI
jgi:diacylglycerol kinase family enzyme